MFDPLQLMSINALNTNVRLTSDGNRNNDKQIDIQELLKGKSRDS